MKLDVVIPYKHSLSNELIYMLRSLQNIPHGNIWIIGDNPKLNVNYIKYVQGVDVAENTLNIMNIACGDERISKNFIWWHDDIYLLKKLAKVPYMHRGSYRNIIDSYSAKGRFNFYTRRMTKTYNKLLTMGIKIPLCYELHIPVVINKNKWNDISKYITKDVNKLSMYGNLHKVGGLMMKDVKVRNKSVVPKGFFISTHDASFGSNEAGEMIRQMFNERSDYEG